MSRTARPSDAERRNRTRAAPFPLDVLYRAVRWTVGHVHGLYAAVGVFLLAGLAVTSAGAALFALIASLVAEGATQRLDQAAVDWARSHASPTLDALAIAGAALGSGMATWLVLGAGSLLLWLTRHHLSVLLLWLSLVGGRWLSHLLKELFDRPRPSAEGWDLQVFGNPIHFPSSASFPSGHAVTSVVVFGTLAYLVVRIEPTVRMRRLTLGIAAALILLIGLSRIYLGVHYPSDVLAGFLVGFVWASFSAFAIEVIRYAAGRDPEVAGEEEDLDSGLRPVWNTFGEEDPGR